MLSRPEIAELAEVSGGGSSTMPQKGDPVLSILLRPPRLSSPGVRRQLHLAAAEEVDERPDGGWHVEAATLRTLGAPHGRRRAGRRPSRRPACASLP